MKAIDFVVRSDAGSVQRDVIQGASSATMVQMAPGDETSLNLSQADIQGYERVDGDLHITLADGRTIILQDYFVSGAEAPRLFLSSDGVLQEVFFAEGQEGALYAEYSTAAEWGKWSPDEALIHYERADVIGPDDGNDVGMLAAGLLGGMGLLGPAAAAGAGAVGLAALTGGGGDGGGGGSDDSSTGTNIIDPTVNDTAIVIGGDGAEERFAVTGTGRAGDTVRVTVGHDVVETTIGVDGQWSAVFEGSDFPVDGVYDAAVVVATQDGDVALDGPAITIDLTGPALTITEGTVEVGDLLNAEGHQDGLTISGTGEVGTSVNVTIAGTTHSADVADDGSWSVIFQAFEIEAGEYTTGVTVTSQDSYGNSSSLTQTVEVDTVGSVAFDVVSIGGDGVVNGAEQAAGITMTGTAEAGSTVVLTVDGVTYPEVIATGEGRWSVDIPGGVLPEGETSVDVSVIATDPAGNTSTDTDTLDIDTYVQPLAMSSVPGGDDAVVNAAEAAAGFTLTGSVEAGSSLTVVVGTTSHTAVVAADGTWTVALAESDLPSGDLQDVTVTLNATDVAGNTRTETGTFALDTDSGYLTIDPAPIEGDDVVNKVEASDGVTINGTATPNMLVTVTLGGVQSTTLSDANGDWSVTYAPGQIPADTDMAEITASITDPAGNSRNAADGVAIDTVVENQGFDAMQFGNDAVVNAAEAQAGVTINGTTEIGATSVLVTIGGITVPASVNAGAGTWSVTMPEAAFRANDEYTVDVSVQSTDAAGNVDSITTSIAVDTWVNDLSMSAASATADGVVSAAELNANGLALSGSVESGSSLEVMFNGQSYTANVAANGAWTLTIPGADVPRGEYDAQISLMATDAAGNPRDSDQVIAIDTVAPDGPQVQFVLEAPTGVAGIFVGAQDEAQAVYEVAADASITAVDHGAPAELGPQTAYSFEANVPDGSHLVVTSADPAGNTRGTFLVLEDGAAGGAVDVANPGLGAMNIDTIQLEFAEDSALTLTEADVLALSSETNTVKVTGGSDDQVTIAGATQGATVNDGADTFVEYTLGEATILVDDDITNVVT
ncbi:Ig-like domain-containing protein [Primorskyibacter sp. S187A]|uniref:Ig-like domain-containing protein n=1 Tax=Primorskyibacter sp. S187A TaxID=3415130 RepID=UPI003C7BB33F